MKVQMVAIVVAIQACVGADDPEVGERAQSERIEVHSCRPGTLELGEGDDMICVEPWPGGMWPRGPDDIGHERTPIGVPGSGGGGGGADPYPIPSPKDCTQEISHEACHACCDWNVDKVWGERCRRLPNRTKEQRKERALCWETAERLRGECQRECPSIITTVAP
jgi:hypothetical protein